MLGYRNTSNGTKKAAEVSQKKRNNSPMVSFIHNGSETTTWMGHKNQKHKIHRNIFKITTSFLNFKLQIIRLAQSHWSCTPTHWNSYFYNCTYEKTYLAVQFTKGCFLSICWQKHFMGLVPWSKVFPMLDIPATFLLYFLA